MGLHGLDRNSAVLAHTNRPRRTARNLPEQRRACRRWPTLPHLSEPCFFLGNRPSQQNEETQPGGHCLCRANVFVRPEAVRLSYLSNRGLKLLSPIKPKALASACLTRSLLLDLSDFAHLCSARVEGRDQARQVPVQVVVVVQVGPKGHIDSGALARHGANQMLEE